MRVTDIEGWGARLRPDPALGSLDPSTLEGDAWHHQSPFPPIADYGFLSDCETTALVAPSGNVEWLCLPRMDSPSVFASVLDRSAGGFRFGPADMTVPAARRYLPGTMVLETSWGTRGGWIIVRDALLIGPWHHDSELSRTHRRAPTDYDAEHVLLRTVRCVNGEVQVTLDCEPVFDYGRFPAQWSYTDRGYHQGTARADGVDIELRLTTDLRIGFEGGRATARTLLKEGQTRFCALSWTEHEPPYTFDEAYRRLVWTAHHWQHWLARGNFPDHRFRGHLERSALTLKGLTFAPTGALAAAATTSLPETPGGERNWDYRYSWIRDSTFALWGLYTLGFDWEANDFFCFIADVAERDADLQIMYGVSGERDLTESILDHLHGYEGARPVRIGNAAHAQLQLDVYGEVVLAAHDYVAAGGRLQRDEARVLAGLGRTVIRRWREPDQGIWEARGAPRHYTFSKVLCWLALDRLLDLEARGLVRVPVEAFRRERAAVAEVIETRGFNPAVSSYTGELDGGTPDASLLLMACLGYRPAADPRMRGTYNFIQRRLGRGRGLLYRYEPGYDGIASPEGAFGICSFWAVDNLVGRGEPEAAERVFTDLLSFGNDLGLFAEETDPGTGAALGNFPQAFTHVGLINAAFALARGRRGGG